MVITYEKLKARAILDLQRRLRLDTSFEVSDKGYNIGNMIEVLPAVINDSSLGEGTVRGRCHNLVAEFEDEAIKIIKKWDIRKVAKLISLFPGIVPQKYKNCKIEIFVRDEDSEWIVAFC